MTLFFLVVGLEARREFDLGELRDRKRFLLPLVAGVLGMLLPVLLYLAVTRGTDAALRLGCRDVDRHGARARLPRRCSVAPCPTGCGSSCSRCFVVDDLVALVVIAGRLQRARSRGGRWSLAVAVFAVFLRARCASASTSRVVYAAMGVVIWVALLRERRRPGRGRAGDRAGRARRTPRAGTTLEEATGAVPRSSARSRPPSWPARRPSG